MNVSASIPHPCLHNFLISLSHKAGFVIIISYYQVKKYKLQPTPRFSLKATTVLSAISSFFILVPRARSPRIGQACVPSLQCVLVCKSTSASDDLVAPSTRHPARTTGISYNSTDLESADLLPGFFCKLWPPPCSHTQDQTPIQQAI